MNRSQIVVLAAVTLIGTGASAHAGPCAAEISQLEQQIRQTQATAPPGGAGEPSAPQSVDAQLHHQPTPQSVGGAEHVANTEGEAALNRARRADAEGNLDACRRALDEARRLYGLE